MVTNLHTRAGSTMEQTEIDGRVLSKCALKPGPLHLNSVISGRPRMVCDRIIVSLKLLRSRGGERKSLIPGSFGE